MGEAYLVSYPVNSGTVEAVHFDLGKIVVSAGNSNTSSVALNVSSFTLPYPFNKGTINFNVDNIAFEVGTSYSMTATCYYNRGTYDKPSGYYTFVTTVTATLSSDSLLTISMGTVTSKFTANAYSYSTEWNTPVSVDTFIKV